jgi:hypothetical protein
MNKTTVIKFFLLGFFMQSAFCSQEDSGRRKILRRSKLGRAIKQSDRDTFLTLFAQQSCSPTELECLFEYAQKFEQKRLYVKSHSLENPFASLVTQLFVLGGSIASFGLLLAAADYGVEGRSFRPSCKGIVGGGLACLVAAFLVLFLGDEMGLRLSAKRYNNAVHIRQCIDCKLLPLVIK